MRTLLILLCCLTAFATVIHAQVPADDAIVAELRETGSQFKAPGVVLWAGAGALPDSIARSFVQDLAAGAAAIERLLGTALDTAHYGPEDEIHVFVAQGVGVSHVYGSYAHMEHPRPYLFLDAAKVMAGEAPYLHELTHILAWKFGSHSLREGLASYVEAVIRTDLGLTSTALFGATSPDAVDDQARARLAGPAAAEVLPWIGAAGFAPGSVTSPDQPRVRAAYYSLSQSFVQHLVRELGLAVFLEIYAVNDPAAELLERTGRNLADWKKHWQQYLEDRA